MVSDELREKYKDAKIIQAISALLMNLGTSGDVMIIANEAIQEFESMITELEDLKGNGESMKITMVDCVYGNVSFDEWFSRFERYCELQGFTEEALATIDKEAYFDYYKDGCTIEETYKEECEYSE